jgi:hypothetical protein
MLNELKALIEQSRHRFVSRCTIRFTCRWSTICTRTQSDKHARCPFADGKLHSRMTFGSHAWSVEASMCVTIGIISEFTCLPVDTVHHVATLKALVHLCTCLLVIDRRLPGLGGWRLPLGAHPAEDRYVCSWCGCRGAAVEEGGLVVDTLLSEIRSRLRVVRDQFSSMF